MGYELHEIYDTPFLKYIDPDDLPRCRLFIESALVQEGRTSGIEYRVCHKDGSASPFLWLDALFQAARRQNVDIQLDTRVERLVMQGERFLAGR